MSKTQCRICDSTHNIMSFNICENCWYELKVYHSDWALNEYITNNLESLRSWMIELLKENACMRCEFGQYWQYGNDCSRQGKPCPQGYDIKPDSSKIKIVPDDDKISRYQYTIKVLKGKIKSLKNTCGRRQREIKRLKKMNLEKSLIIDKLRAELMDIIEGDNE